MTMNSHLQDNNTINQKLAEIQQTLELLTDTLSGRTQDENQLITIKEVSSIIGFNPDWIYKRIATNEFPKPIKIGRASRWNRTTINEWLAGCAHK